MFQSLDAIAVIAIVRDRRRQQYACWTGREPAIANARLGMSGSGGQRYGQQ
ncbi:MAG: hypothetical protein ACM3SS_25045 [Rhodospirillaceae bacterium]